MKTEVYRWRLSAARKAELESEARRKGTSVSNLLEQITAEWLAERRKGDSGDDAEQAAIRRRAQPVIGSIHGGDPTRAERASQLVREIIYRKHLKESNAFARRHSRPNSRSAG
jgi:hypothetical protein